MIITIIINISIIIIIISMIIISIIIMIIIIRAGARGRRLTCTRWGLAIRHVFNLHIKSGN